MCCLLICTKRPSLETLSRISSANRDGAGVAWFGKSNCEYKKGFDTAKQVHDFLDTIKLPYAIHFRLASIGGKSSLLTHPFEVSRNSDLKLQGKVKRLLFHNGHISDWEKMLVIAGVLETSGNISDTRALSMIIANHPDGGKKFLKSLNNKFVLMNIEKRVFQVIGDFTEDDGIYYSNCHWKYRGNAVTYAEYHGGGGDEHWSDDDIGCSSYYYRNQGKSAKSCDLGFVVGLKDNEKKSFRKRLNKVFADGGTNQELNGSNESNEIKDAEVLPPKAEENKSSTYLENSNEKCFLCECLLPIFRVNILNGQNLKDGDRVCYTCEKTFSSADRQKAFLDRKRIHELPIENFYSKMGDETKKILGMPIKKEEEKNGY